MTIKIQSNEEVLNCTIVPDRCDRYLEHIAWLQRSKVHEPTNCLYLYSYIKRSIQLPHHNPTTLIRAQLGIALGNKDRINARVLTLRHTNRSSNDALDNIGCYAKLKRAAGKHTSAIKEEILILQEKKGLLAVSLTLFGHAINVHLKRTTSKYQHGFSGQTNETYPGWEHRCAMAKWKDRRRAGCVFHTPWGGVSHTSVDMCGQLYSVTDLQSWIDDPALVAREHRAGPRRICIYDVKSTNPNYTRNTYGQSSLWSA